MMSDQVYKTGSDVRIYLTLAVNNHFIWVDDCLGLSFSESTQKTPVFGYASRFFDAVAEGPSLITGSITIALRAASTLSQLKSYSSIYQPNLASPLPAFQDALKNAYWKRGTDSELGLTGSMETIHPPLAIVIAYGEYSSNAEFVVKSSKKIMDIHISNAQEGVAQDDSPLVRSYAFIGRKIVNDYSYVTPVSARSNGHDPVIAAGSSRSQGEEINWAAGDTSDEVYGPPYTPPYPQELIDTMEAYEASLADNFTKSDFCGPLYPEISASWDMNARCMRGPTPYVSVGWYMDAPCMRGPCGPPYTPVELPDGNGVSFRNIPSSSISPYWAAASMGGFMYRTTGPGYYPLDRRMATSPSDNTYVRRMMTGQISQLSNIVGKTPHVTISPYWSSPVMRGIGNSAPSDNTSVALPNRYR